MITLARRNGQPVIVNADLIELVERSDDGATVITLTTGNVLEVVQLPHDVAETVIAYRQRIAGRT